MARHLEETAGLISRTDGTKDGALRSSSKGAKQGCKIYYVYLVRSASVPQQRYVGFTENLKQRIADHNAGQNPSTAPYRPWRLVTYLAFSDKQQAFSCERYLKSGSGHAFANRRLW
jgi:predicted GIY-YIG superfamily endonuclease